MSQPPAKTKPPLTAKVRRRFLDAAASAMAEERGLTARCRVKLESLAREMGMSAAELDETLNQLGSAPETEPDDPALARRKSKYRHYVEKQMDKLPRGVLTESIRLRIEEAGAYQFKLDEASAAATLRDAVRELKVHTISRQDASGSVAQMTRSLARDGWLPPSEMERVQSAGIELGLSHDEVADVVRETLASDYHAGRRWRLAGMIGGAAIAGIAVACGLFFAWNYLVAETRPDPPAPAESVATDDPPTKPRPEEPRPKAVPLPAEPDWWDVDLTLAATQLRLKTGGNPAVQAALGQIRAAEADERRAGYQTLLTALARAKADRTLQGIARDLLRSLVALEPDDPAATGVLSASISAAMDPLENPSDANHVLRSFWWGDLIGDLLHGDRLEAGRQAELLALANDAFGLDLTEADSRIAIRRAVRGALARKFYVALAEQAAAEEQPDESVLLGLLREQSLGVLSPEERLRLEARWLEARLRRDPAGWADERELIQQVVAAGDVDQLRQMLALFERTEHDELRQFLRAQLALRTGVAAIDEDAWLKAARERLGLPAISAETARRQRWERLSSQASGALRASSVGRGADSPREQVRRLVGLVQGSTTAAAFAQGDGSLTVFEEWLSKEPPKFEPTSSAATPTPKPAIRGEEGTYLKRLTQQLRSYRRLSAAARSSAFRRAAGLLQDTRDIDDETASVLARYLLAAKGESEQGEIALSFRPVLALPRVRLALADGIQDARLAQHLLAELAKRALGRPIEPDADQRWRGQVARELIESAATVLEARSGGRTVQVGGDAAQFEAGAAALVEAYRQQALLAGVDSATAGKATSPAQLLELLLRAEVESASSPELANFRRDLRPRLEAMRYVAGGPLREAVLMQGLLLEARGLTFAAESPERADEAARIISETFAAREGSSSALEQWRLGEEGALRLWLLQVRPRTEER